jgi:acyl-CoA synthetase (AMP-forming)/AMP-acid ligase II
LSKKVGSVGIAIPGGSLRIDQQTTELVYQGSNVMMGYALSRDDLAKPDECSGILHTGDLGKQDEDGFFYLTGRLRRFVKLAGNRVNMDEVEAALSKTFAVMVVCSGTDDRLAVVLPAAVAIKDAQVHVLLRDLFNIYAGSVRIHRFPEFPHLANGKLDYQLLEAMVAAR